MKQKYKKILSLIGLSFFVANLVFVAATPVMIYAQAAPTPAATPPPASTATAPIPAGEGEKDIAAYLCVPGTGLYPCINRLYRFALAAAFFITVLFIVFAGYQYMLGGEKGKEDAKGRISAAVIAIVILSTSFILLRQINPDLVEFKKIDPLKVDTSGDKGKLLDLLPLCKDVGNKPPCRGLDIPGSDDPDGGAAGAGTNGGTSLDLNETACGRDSTDPSVNCVNLQDDAYGIACPPARDNCWVQKTLGSKLLALAANTNKVNVFFRVSEAWKPTYLKHKDQCHNTGACVDMVVTKGTFKQLCAAFPGSGLSIWNETGEASTECGADHTSSNTTNPHLHVYLGGGGGSSGGDAPTGPTGSRPNCIVNSEFKFLCNSPGADPYPTKVITASDSAVQANLTEVAKRLTAAGIDIKSNAVRQVYRPHEYGAHLRSYWEAYALIKGKSDDWVRTTGYYCDGSIQYVKKSDIDALTPDQKNKILAHASSSHSIRSLDFNTTCLSDHGYGYSFDYGTGSAAETAKLNDVNLCHNLNGGKWNQDRDNGHYVLKEKNRNDQGCE